MRSSLRRGNMSGCKFLGGVGVYLLVFFGGEWGV